MASLTIVANPAAGKGRGLRVVEKLEAALRQRGVPFESHRTRSRGDASVLAHNAPNGTIVAVGGDGTVNEVANGLAGSEKVLGVIPAGSGNDFIKSIGIPASFSEALEVLLQAKTGNVDVGKVLVGGNSAPRYFVNGVGMGFDAAVADQTGRIRFFSGTPLYVVAVMQTLGRYRAPLFSVDMDDLKLKGRNLLIAIGNGTCAGGGFYLTPEAKIDDGLLDVCIIGDIPVRTILRIMPLVMRGKHRKSVHVSYYKSKHINILTAPPESFVVHADGEIIGRNVDDVRISVGEQQLKAIVGPLA
ncbi:MAG: diacylglycerol kinase family lipid kinase [Ignavibacteria bacterium]|nr:diacylglycerol kinase family lipid kinase [Ignavibacteria bacterium]